MKKYYKVVTKSEVIEVEDSGTSEVGALIKNGSEFSMVLSKEDAEDIDITERKTMDVMYNATRSALSEHFTAISKKKVKKPVTSPKEPLK